MKVLIAILALLLLLLQYRLWFGEGSVSELRQTGQFIEQQQLENRRLEQRNNVLEAEVVELQKGLETVEDRARNDLGMVKEGEEFYLTPDN